MRLNIKDIRHEYKKKKLSKASVNADPFKQFEKWMEEALISEDEPTAMIVTSVSETNQPSSRAVLLKEVDDDNRLVFYSNYQSRKGVQIAQNPKVSATFFWPKLERQVHFEGIAAKIDPMVSDEYFQTRPRKSRIGACISPQSRVINSRNDIKTAFVKMAGQYLGRKVPRPAHWGGYGIRAHRIEFWQGRSNRLHDRILFQLKEDQTWSVERLAP